MAFAKIEAAARRDAGQSEKLLRGSQAAQAILIPALIGGLAWFRDDIQKAGGVGLFLLLLVVFVLVQFWLFFVSTSAKQSVQDLYFVSKDLQNQLDASRTQIQQLKNRTELFILTEKFASACSYSLLDYSSQNVADSEGLKRIIANFLEPLASNGEQIFGFGPAEKWNFVVYFFSTTANVLLPVWREKAQSHPSQGLGRTWGRGQGHVGFSFANSRAIITEDARNPDVQSLVTAAEGHAREYDTSTYVSFASIPIGPVGESDEPIGVLVATSDRAGRFTSENSRILAHAALAIANAVSVAEVDLTTIVVQ
jgi:hypothetical protein